MDRAVSTRGSGSSHLVPLAGIGLTHVQAWQAEPFRHTRYVNESSMSPAGTPLLG
jgi:hypothetical protein